MIGRIGKKGCFFRWELANNGSRALAGCSAQECDTSALYLVTALDDDSTAEGGSRIRKRRFAPLLQLESTRCVAGERWGRRGVRVGG